jgi:hypothetical protein
MQVERRLEHVMMCEDILQEKSQVYTKLNFSIEKKIERLWQESEKNGWKFNQFVTAALEVLTILHHRNKVRLSGETPKKILHRKRALS